MRTLGMEHFYNSADMLFLYKCGDAKPVGKEDAESDLVWVATDKKEKVVRIGLILKGQVREK
jgi:hypothetical protein